MAHELFTKLETFLGEIRPVRRRLDTQQETQLCRYCYALALFDELHYAPTLRPSSPLAALFPTDTLDDLFALIQPSQIEDLCQMSQRFFDGYQAITEARAVVNPHFTYRVTGASADLLVGGYLVDFKASTHARLDPIWLYQVLGYTLLDFDHSLGIRGISVYMARHGVLVRWSLKTLLPMLTGSDTVALDELRQRYRTFLDA